MNLWPCRGFKTSPSDLERCQDRDWKTKILSHQESAGRDNNSPSRIRKGEAVFSSASLWASPYFHSVHSRFAFLLPLELAGSALRVQRCTRCARCAMKAKQLNKQRDVSSPGNVGMFSLFYIRNALVYL